jgi:hypothetical protein
MKIVPPPSVSLTSVASSGVESLDTGSLNREISKLSGLETMLDGLPQKQVYELHPKLEKAKENGSSALSYKPPRFSSPKIQFTWDLFDSGNI